jgi:hypothetical protein
MASRWIPSLVALEIKAAWRSTRTPDEIRQLIREMSVANPLWAAPRMHGVEFEFPTGTPVRKSLWP